MMATPVRRALRPDSSLRPMVKDGIAALKKAHRTYLAMPVRTAFADSLDLDEAMKASHPQENRWDYLLGHKASGEVVGLEPHSAKDDQITKVIEKKEAAKQHLVHHLMVGERVSRWLWVASGTVHFADTESARLRLDQHGIKFVGREVRAEHLP